MSDTSTHYASVSHDTGNLLDYYNDYDHRVNGKRDLNTAFCEIDREREKNSSRD